jgi:hypothetical protein
MPPGRGILAHNIDTAGRLVAVEILLRVSRGAGDRLDGSACISGGTEVREFSGMLELMRVFEELIPAPGSEMAITGRCDGASQRSNDKS